MGNISPSQIRSTKVLLSPRPSHGRQGPRNMFQALLPYEIKLLLKSWKTLRAKRELAISMFADVLLQKPELKGHFGLESLDKKQLLVSEALYDHANKFMGFLGTILDSLDDPTMHEGTLESLDFLGAFHAKVGIRFDAIDWLPFKNCVKEHFCRGQSEEIAKAWTKFIGLVISQMRQSYHAEIRRSLSSPREISKQCFPANAILNGELTQFTEPKIVPTITIDNLLLVDSDYEGSPPSPNSENSSVGGGIALVLAAAVSTGLLPIATSAANAASFILVILLRVVLGLGDAFVNPSVNRFIINWFPKEKRTLALTVVTCGRQFAFPIGLPNRRRILWAEIMAVAFLLCSNHIACMVFGLGTFHNLSTEK